MIIFAARGRGMKLVIDKKFIAKDMKILSRFYIIYLKRKLRTCKIQILFENI